MFALVFDYITDTHVGPIRESSLCSESGEFVYRRKRVATTDGRRKVVNERFSGFAEMVSIVVYSISVRFRGVV
jgi:hypothetical protein